jgi:hypothetical protein
MKRLLLFIFLSGAFTNLINQQKPDDNCTGSYDKKLKKYVYQYADSMPEFPGGMDKCYEFIQKIRLVPDPKNIQSRVVFSFVIDIDGCIIGEEIYKKRVADYTIMEKSLIKGLKRMPKWKPGICNGKKIPFRMTIPMHINWSQ